MTLRPFANDDLALRASIHQRIRAVRNRDVEGLLSFYSPEVVTFDRAAPADHGLDGVRRRAEEWFDSFEADIDYRLRSMVLVVDGDAAFHRHVVGVRGRHRSGEVVDQRYREVFGYRRVAGQWLVVQQHRAALDRA